MQTTIAFVTEAELRASAPQLDLSAYDTPTISGMLLAATVMAENFLNYSLAFETKTEKVRGVVGTDGDLIIFPNKRPVLAFHSAAIKKGGFSANLTLSSGGKDFYDIIDDSKVVISSYQVSLQQVSIISWAALRQSSFFLEISYDCGFPMDDRPADIIQAVLLYARELFARERNQSGASEISQGALTIKYSDSKGKSDFIKDAEAILMDYKPTAGF